VESMSHDGGSEKAQRTVAELLAKYGNGEGGERTPRRRRRRDEDDMSDTGAQAIIDRVLSESGELPAIREDQPPPTSRAARRRRAEDSRPADRPVERPVERRQPPPAEPLPERRPEPRAERRAEPPVERRAEPPSRRAVPPVPPAASPTPPPTPPTPPTPPSRRLPAIAQPAPPTQPVRQPPTRRAVPPVPPPTPQRSRLGEGTGIRQNVGNRLDSSPEIEPVRPRRVEPELPAIRQEATTEELPRMAPPTPDSIGERLATPPRRPRPAQDTPANRGQLDPAPYPAADSVEEDEDYYPGADPDADGYAEEPYAGDEYADGDYAEDYEDADYDELDDERDDLDLDELDELDEAEAPERSPAKEWALMAAQLAGGVIGGAGVWLVFNWLWGVLPAAALVVALGVIVGMVLIVRKIRRADDLQTTVLAVLVGLVVTVSPAALLLLND
jgi:hypothetical protein